MVRFESSAPALPDRRRFNPFTRQALPELRGRPAALDFIELAVDGAVVWRVRGAFHLGTTEPIYATQEHAIAFPDRAAAQAALDGLVAEVHTAGWKEAPPTNIRASSSPVDPRGQDARSFARALDVVPWFVNVALPINDRVDRIASFEAWPGPEDPVSELLAARMQECADDVHGVDHGLDILERVTTRASWNVAYDPDRDVWDPAIASVHQAAFTSDLVARHLAGGRAIPDDLLELWSWFARGQWPWGIADAGLVVL